MADLDELFADVERRVQHERGPLAAARALPTSVRLALALALAVLAPLLSVLLTPRADLSVYPGWRLVGDLVLVALPVVAASLALVRPLHRPLLPRGAEGGLLLGAFASVAILIALPPAHAAHPASLAGLGDDLVPRAVACLLFGLAFGLPTAAVVHRLRRGPGSGLLAAGLGAVVGVAALVLHCPIVHRAHLAAGHGTVLVVAVLAAMLLARLRGRATT